jgi:hypothetical protein
VVNRLFGDVELAFDGFERTPSTTPASPDGWKSCRS